MVIDNENEMPLRSYLLGDLSQEEQEDLEKRLMTGSAAFEELQLVEDEIIDEYLEGDLSDRDKAKFENLFLAAPERKQKLRFAISLKRYIAEHKPEPIHRPSVSVAGWLFQPGRSPIMKWALAASFLLLIGGGTWSTVRISNLQTALERERAEAGNSQKRLEEVQGQNVKLGTSLEQEQIRSSRLEQEITELKENRKTGPSLLPGQIPSTTSTATLDPRRSRSSSDMQEVTIPPGKDLVRIDLKMEPLTYPRYKVVLRRLGGDEIFDRTESSVDGRFPGQWISAKLLADGDYLLNLSGIPDSGEAEELDDYYFRVRH